MFWKKTKKNKNKNNDLNKDIFIGTDKEYQHKDGYKVKGRTFHITGIKNFAGCVDIIFDDWTVEDGE